MNIGQAVEALKAGYRVARKGWNGEGMWLSLTPSKIVEAHQFWSPQNRAYAEMQGDQRAQVRPYVTMKTADGAIVPWAASQSDLLADDWAVV